MKNILIFSVISILFCACAIKDVKPWQKGIHAKDSMKDGGVNSLAKKFDAHIFFSKEATKIGNGIAGGGCGCN